MRIKFGAIFILIVSSLSGQQNFKGSAVFGFSAAQLGGDSLSGYNKLGLTAGMKLSYALDTRFDVSLDLLYTQRGSRESLGFSQGASNTTALNYIEIAPYITINDWYYEKEDYYKVGAFLGLSYAYLFSVNSSNPILSDKSDLFNDHDIGARIGLFYSFTKNITFRVYYTDSFLNVLDSEDLFGTNALDSFNWTFRIDYNF